MTLQQFISKYKGKSVDFDGAYGSQCVDLFRFYVKEVLEINQPKSVSGAKDFWSNYDTDSNLKDNFKKIPNTPEFIPNPGDVMVWNGWYGPYGHIAIVTQADINKFTCLSQNDPVGRETHLKEYSYSKVYGVLRPNKSVNDSSPPDGYVTKAEWQEERDERNKNWDLYQGEIAKVGAIRGELNKFMETLAGKLTTIVDKAEIIGAVETLLSQESEMNRKLASMEKAYEQLKEDKKNEIEQLKKEIDELRAANGQQAKMIDRLEDRVARLEENRPDPLKDFMEKLLSIFRR